LEYLEEMNYLEKQEEDITRHGSYYINRAFYYMIIAISLKFVVFLIDGIFSSLFKY